MGELDVTVAVRLPDASTAISPNRSPGPSSRTGAPSTVTAAVPSTIAKTQWPKSPSRVRSTPASASTRSARSASVARSPEARLPKSGTLRSSPRSTTPRA